MNFDMKKVGISLTAAVLPAMTSQAMANTQKIEKPNIIYILADDLGFGDLGCFGQKLIKTPNLDKMAAEGLRFTNHYAGSTVCGPSRACMLTGQHSGHTYLRGNGRLAMRRNPHDIVIPQVLKKAGYHSAMIGKSGLACNSDDGKLPNDKGFDYFFGLSSHTAAHWYFPPYLWKNGEKVNYPKNKLHEGDHFSTTEIAKEALAYIERQKDGPFFMHVAFQEPHASLRAPEKFKKMYRGKFGKEPVVPQRHYSGTKEPKTTYAAMVSHMDHNVGLLVKKLKDLGIDKKTIIMFASDNGSMQEGGYRRDWFKSSGILRGGKRDLYEGGIRTPMIAYWPGTIKPGGVTNHISAFWDVMPTVCELAGLPAPSNTDGISFVPTLVGKKQKKHNHLYWEFHEGKGKIAIRKGKWKAVRFNTKKNANSPLELYDLSKDPSEKNNLAKKHPEIASELRKLMDKSHTPSQIFKIAGDK